jgi:hypothetical protein
MNGAAILERRYRWLLGCYPASFRSDNEDEVLGVLMASAGDGKRWPSAAETADVLRSALRMRLRLPRPGTESTRWTDTWAVFSVLGPVFMLVTNIVVVLLPPMFLRVHVKVPAFTGLMPLATSWLRNYDYAPYGWAHPFYTALICQAILVVLVLAGWRWPALVVLVASAVLWAKSGYTFPPPVTLINASTGILELGALAAWPGPRHGRQLLNWRHGVVLVLVIAAVKLSSMTFPVLGWRPLATTPPLAWVLLASSAALVVIAGAVAIRLRLGWHALWIGAALLYPYVLEFASVAFGSDSYRDLLRLGVGLLHMAILFLGPVVMALLAVLIAARGRLASSRARLTPGS